MTDRRSRQRGDVPPDLAMTDSRLRSWYQQRAATVQPTQALVDDVMAIPESVPSSGALFDWLPSRRLLLVLATAALLIALSVGAAVVGSWLVRRQLSDQVPVPPAPSVAPTPSSATVLADLSKAGQNVVLDLYAAQTDDSPATGPSKPGDQNYIAWDLYELSETAPFPDRTGEPIGRQVADCTLITTTEGLCHSVLDISGRGTIAIYLEVNLARSGLDPAAVTGGTGEFAGASGTLQGTEVPGKPNDHVYHVVLTAAVQQ